MATSKTFEKSQLNVQEIFTLPEGIRKLTLLGESLERLQKLAIDCPPVAETLEDPHFVVEKMKAEGWPMANNIIEIAQTIKGKSQSVAQFIISLMTTKCDYLHSFFELEEKLEGLQKLQLTGNPDILCFCEGMKVFEQQYYSISMKLRGWQDSLEDIQFFVSIREKRSKQWERTKREFTSVPHDGVTWKREVDELAHSKPTKLEVVPQTNDCIDLILQDIVETEEHKFEFTNGSYPDFVKHYTSFQYMDGMRGSLLAGISFDNEEEISLTEKQTAALRTIVGRRLDLLKNILKEGDRIVFEIGEQIKRFFVYLHDDGIWLSAFVRIEKDTRSYNLLPPESLNWLKKHDIRCGSDYDPYYCYSQFNKVGEGIALPSLGMLILWHGRRHNVSAPLKVEDHFFQIREIIKQ